MQGTTVLVDTQSHILGVLGPEADYQGCKRQREFKLASANSNILHVPSPLSPHLYFNFRRKEEKNPCLLQSSYFPLEQAKIAVLQRGFFFNRQ